MQFFYAALVLEYLVIIARGKLYLLLLSHFWLNSIIPLVRLWRYCDLVILHFLFKVRKN